VEFMFWSGWRKREVLGLEWKQVDFRAGVVRLERHTTKSGEGRVFPFVALPALATLLRHQRDITSALERETGAIIPWVFHRRGRAIRSCHEAWVNACTRAGRPGRLLHDFRRTVARRMERAGVPRSQAKALIGHKTDSVYARYSIVAERDLEEAVAKVAAQVASDRATASDAVVAIASPANTASKPLAATSPEGDTREARGA
jgi:integrase